MATQVMAAPPPPMKLDDHHDHHDDGPPSTNGGSLSPLSHAQSMDSLSGSVSAADDEVFIHDITTYFM